MKTKAKYRFIEFIRPDGFWPLPYTLEQAFGVFAWMLRTGEGYHDQGQWGRHDIRSLLSCKPTCVNFSAIEPIVSVADLERRFHHAILSDYVGPGLRRWREEHRVTPSGEAVIRFPHHGLKDGPFSEAHAKSGIDRLLNARGWLGVQLNSCWNNARDIQGVTIHWRGCYRFEMRYGFPNESSSWCHTLARQLPGESFYATFRRASANLAKLIDGKKAGDAA